MSNISSAEKFRKKLERKERERQEIVSSFFYSTRYWKFGHRLKLAWAILFKAWGQKKRKKAMEKKRKMEGKNE